MVNLNDVVQYLHPGSEPLRDYTVSADRNGQRISQWDATALGPQPTAERLAEVAASAEFLAWRDDRPKRRRREKFRELIALAENDDVLLLILTIAEEIFESLREVRTRNGLPNRTWQQLVQSIIQRGESKVNGGNR